MSSLPDSKAVWDALRTILDPEFGLNIVDMGLVYSVECQNGDINVVMTLTTPSCPSGAWIHEGAQTVVTGLEGARQVNVSLVFEPPWTPALLTEEGRQYLGYTE